MRMRPMTLAERGVGTSTVSLDASQGRAAAGRRSDRAGSQGLCRRDPASGFPGYQATFRALRRRNSTAMSITSSTGSSRSSAAGSPPRHPQRWMVAYAAATATTTTFEKIRDAATSDHGEKPSRPTIQPYRDMLESLWILDPVPAWLPTRNRLGLSFRPPSTTSPIRRLRPVCSGWDAEALLQGASPRAEGYPARARSWRLVRVVGDALCARLRHGSSARLSLSAPGVGNRRSI